MYKIIDNFLDNNDFNDLQTLLISDNFPWFFNYQKIYTNEKVDNLNNYQFTHSFIIDEKNNSNYTNIVLEKFNKKIHFEKIYRLKANLTTRTENIYKFDNHIDTEKQCNVAIFYINNNNGKTILNGENINSIENRILIMPNNIYHSATTCSDKKARIVINFNFIGDIKK